MKWKMLRGYCLKHWHLGCSWDLELNDCSKLANAEVIGLSRLWPGLQRYIPLQWILCIVDGRATCLLTTTLLRSFVYLRTTFYHLRSLHSYKWIHMHQRGSIYDWRRMGMVRTEPVHSLICFSSWPPATNRNLPKWLCSCSYFRNRKLLWI